MRKLLNIGAAAGLVGITPKAIRNYHKLGLLTESERSEAGYRLYSASDLVKMRRIRRMQELGLSLRRIREVLGDPEGSPSLRKVLEALLSEVSAETSKLKERKRSIEGMLAREDLNDVAESSSSSPTFKRFKETFGGYLHEMSPETLEQEERLWSAIDAFKWPEEQVEAREAVVRYYAKHPQTYREIFDLGERLTALSEEPEDSPEVERLAEDFCRYHEEKPLPVELSGAPPLSKGPLGQTFADLILDELSPAQRRCMELVRRRSGDIKNGTECR